MNFVAYSILVQMIWFGHFFVLWGSKSKKSSPFVLGKNYINGSKILVTNALYYLDIYKNFHWFAIGVKILKNLIKRRFIFPIPNCVINLPNKLYFTPIKRDL